MKIDFNNMVESTIEHFKGGEKNTKTKKFSDKQNSIIYGKLEVGATIGLHTHETSSEIVYILSGTGKMLYDNTEEPLKEGDCHYCPKGHSHSLVNTSDKEELVFFAVIPEQNVFDKMKERRSIRCFKKEIPPKQMIEKVIEAGRWAASGRNKQSSIIIAVTNKEIIEKLTKINGELAGRNKSSGEFYGAPVILIVLSDKNWRNKTYDGSLILGNMMLAAHDMGLGTCWIHRAKEEFETDEWQEWLKTLGVEGEWEGIGHLALGYPEGEYPKEVERTGNKVFWCE